MLEKTKNKQTNKQKDSKKNKQWFPTKKKKNGMSGAPNLNMFKVSNILSFKL